MECLRISGADHLVIANSPTLGANRNTIRACAGSFRPDASGMQSFENFCEFTGRMPFPVQTDTVLLRGNMFKPGRTQAMYTAHLMKAAILAKQPTDWMRPCIKSVASGLANAQDLSFRFGNFLFPDDLLRLIRTTKITSDFGRASFFPFIFLWVVPSETLTLRKDAADGPITDLAPQKVKILAAVRIIGGNAMRLAKFAWRKNMKRGCIPRIPFLCGVAESIARVLWPVHRIWPQLADRIRTGDLLFRTMKCSFVRHLRANLALAGMGPTPQRRVNSPHAVSGAGLHRNCK